MGDMPSEVGGGGGGGSMPQSGDRRDPPSFACGVAWTCQACTTNNLRGETSCTICTAPLLREGVEGDYVEVPCNPEGGDLGSDSATQDEEEEEEEEEELGIFGKEGVSGGGREEGEEQQPYQPPAMDDSASFPMKLLMEGDEGYVVRVYGDPPILGLEGEGGEEEQAPTPVPQPDLPQCKVSTALLAGFISPTFPLPLTYPPTLMVPTLSTTRPFVTHRLPVLQGGVCARP